MGDGDRNTLNYRSCTIDNDEIYINKEQANVGNRIVNRNMVTGARKRQFNAVAHKAGTDHRDLLGFCHCSARRIAAIGVENVAGVEVRRPGRQE